MVREIDRSSEAPSDLFAIKEYAAQRSPAHAGTVVRAIEPEAGTLITVPHGYHLALELSEVEHRETFVHSRLPLSFGGRAVEGTAQAEYVAT